MRLAATNVLSYTLACLTAAAVVPRVGAAQVALPGEQDPAGRVYTHVVVRVGELGSNTPPIQGLPVYVVSADGRRLTLRTNMAGVAATWLPRALYRIVTPEPFQFEERLYTWDTLAAIRPGMGLVRLHLANAKSRPVPVAGWRPADAGSSEAFKDARTWRTLVRDGVTVSATLARDEDVLWADLTISNISRRSLVVDPRVFTLNKVSAPQTVMRYRSPADVAQSMKRSKVGTVMRRRSTKGLEQALQRALQDVTLAPGQAIVGSVFFDRAADARDVMLRIPLSGVTFEVPFNVP